MSSIIRFPIAIVGMSCRLPNADSLEEYWSLLIEGRDAISELPSDRLDQELYFAPQKGVRGKTYSKIGGMIRRRPLDTNLVPLAKTHYDDFDECHWILAEVVARAWKHAGKRPMPSTLSDSESDRVGVYIGHSGGSRKAGELVYATLAAQAAELLHSVPQFLQLSSQDRDSLEKALIETMREGKTVRRIGGRPYLEASSAARLIAETLGLQGPQMVIDAACASSLASLAMGCLDLQSRNIDAAIVGGASYNKSDSLILFANAQSCSSTGTRPFDEKADGLISSEGYVALVLKRLEDATRDGDKVWGVIRGMGMSTDGRGKSLWAPRREGQFKAMERAYSAEFDVDRIQYIEAHATSTQVGDATEMSALADFFGPYANDRRIPVGSVKSNIGHTLETAGLAGLLKTALAMHHQTIPPNVHFETPSSSIPWESIPFDIPTTAQRWESNSNGRPRCAAVNAFGIGGLNVHVVLEEAAPQTGNPQPTLPSLTRQTSISGNTRQNESSIAIVGRGVIVPGAQGIAAFQRLMASKASMIIDPPKERWPSHRGISLRPELWSTTTARGGYLTDYAYDWRKHRVPPKQVENANPLQFMLLDAAGEAIDEAQRGARELDRDTTSVVVGTIFGGEFGHDLQMGLRLVEMRRDISVALRKIGKSDRQIDDLLEQFESLFLKRYPALLDETGSFTSSTLASRITKQYNLQGGALSIDTGVCSCLSALHASINLLRSGTSSSVICASGSRSMDLPAYENLAAKGLLTGENSRLPGEGVCVLVLKRLEDAQRDGNEIFGVIGSIRTHRESHPSRTEPRALQHVIGELQGSHAMVEILAHVTASQESKKVIFESTDDGLVHMVEVDRRVQQTNPTARPSLLPTAESIAPLPKQTTPFPPMPIQRIAEMPVPNRNPNRDRNHVVAFPGQGSQSKDGLDVWLRRSPRASLAFELAQSVLAQLGSEPFSVLLESAVAGRTESTWYTQATMLISDVVLWHAWRELGNEVDVVIGHSLGELAALVAAEAWNLGDALRFTRQRAAAVDNCRIEGAGLLSVNLALDQLNEELRTLPGTVWVTHINGPNQTVVGGTIEALQAFNRILEKKKITTVALSVPAPFHTPLMASAARELALQVDSMVLLPPRIPFFSTVSNRYESDPLSLKRNLILQLTTPVNYLDAIRRLAQDGANTLFEVGPGKVLTRLHEAILKDIDANCLSMDRLVDSPIAKTQRSFTEPLPSVFDATSHRRQRLKAMSSQRYPSAPMVATQIDQPIVNKAPEAAPVASLSPTLSTKKVNQPELEAFIRDFIVEQTGYPSDMIQLDWDLEADLGIDSIKLVQLMGELRELFDLDPSLVKSANVRTIRDIIQLLEGSGGKREWLVDDESSRPEDARPEDARSSSIAMPKPGPYETRLSNPVIALETPTVVGATNEAPASRELLETFVVDFVVEHTGYPKEMVDLDADIEADLGLDSIKLAQLFGELRTHFSVDLEGDQRKKLASVRTLSQVLDIVHVPVQPTTQSVESVSLEELGRKYAASIQHQLVSDFQDLEKAESVRFPLYEPTERNRIAEFCVTADNANVHVDNLIGLLGRHGDKHEWRELSERLPTLRIRHVEPESPPANVPAVIPERSPSITKRFILRREPSQARLVATAKPIFNGPAVILGNNAVGQQLAARLSAFGVKTFLLNSMADTNQLLESFEELSQKQGFIPHLFLANPHDTDAAPKAFDSIAAITRKQAILNAFWLTQRWYIKCLQQERINDSSLFALTRLGGDFGFHGQTEAPESGALAGLLKAVLIESWVNGHRQLPIKVIDTGRSESASYIVDKVVLELANPTFDTEVAWQGEQRYVVRASEKPIFGGSRKPSPGVWICTGGGRGITAYVAQRLAKRYGLELHLIGTAPVPSHEQDYRNLDDEQRRRFKSSIMANATQAGKNSVKAWQDAEKQLEIDANLRRMHEDGITAFYHSCDVANRDAIEACIAEIRSSRGPILGVLHGAGVGQDSRFDRKRTNKVSDCVDAKVTGLLNVMHATASDPLEYFLGFGSISGRFGANGHTDYSMANEALAKYVGWYQSQRPKVRSIAFHWHAWGDVGMAVKPETRLALEMIDMQFMPAEEGMRHLIDEIESDASEREVLITDDRYYRMFYPAETLTPTTEAVRQYPLMEDDVELEKQTPHTERSYKSMLDPIRDVFLREHRLQNVPLLPFVISMELIAEASKKFDQTKKQLGKTFEPILLENFIVHRALKFHDDSRKEVNLSVKESRSESLSASEKSPQYRTELTSDFLNRTGQVVERQRLYASGGVSFGPNRILDWKPIPIDWQSASRVQYPPSDNVFYSGPAFQVLKSFSLQGERIFGRILAPSLIEMVGSHRNNEGWMMPSAVLDACLFASGILTWHQLRKGVCLPVSVEKLLLLSLPQAGESCLLESRHVGGDDKHVLFDFCLWGNDGRELVQCTQYKSAWIAE